VAEAEGRFVEDQDRLTSKKALPPLRQLASINVFRESLQTLNPFKMKTVLKTIAVALFISLGCKSSAQIYETNNVLVQPFVGSGFYGLYDGQGELTMFNNPSGVVADSSGNLFVADTSNYRIRRVTPSGNVSTFVGGGATPPPGYGTNVHLNNYYLTSLAIDRSNTLWVALGYYSPILKITPDGLTIPINLPSPGPSSLGGICLDSKNNIYLSDSSGNRIYRYLTNNTLEVFAGSGNPGAIDGNWIFTSFLGPTHLVADAADNIYVWDSGNNLIRRINQNRDVVTLAGRSNSNSEIDGVGTNAAISRIHGMTMDSAGNLIFSSGSSWFTYAGTCVRKMSSTGKVTTLAGSFSGSGYINGPGTNALFYGLQGLCMSGGDIYLADKSSHRIRKITQGTNAPIAPTSLELKTYPGVKITGNVGRTYRIESSTNSSTWTYEAELQLTSSPLLWIDPTAVNGQKFYRTVLLP
jgi:sugar lactone lactonase YvrE